MNSYQKTPFRKQVAKARDWKKVHKTYLKKGLLSRIYTELEFSKKKTGNDFSEMDKAFRKRRCINV